jgi:hypothetical protein
MKLQDNDRKKFRRLQWFRVAVCGFTVAALAHILELGTATIFLVLAAITGVLYAGRRLKAGDTFARALAVHLVVAVVLIGGCCSPPQQRSPITSSFIDGRTIRC